jgi:hypothetical protein
LKQNCWSEEKKIRGFWVKAKSQNSSSTGTHYHHQPEKRFAWSQNDQAIP